MSAPAAPAAPPARLPRRGLPLGLPARALTVLALILGGVWAGLTLRLETEFLPLLPAQLPSVRGLTEFQERFASDREVLVVADPAMPEEERTAAFRALQPALAAVPGVVGVAVPGEEMAQHWPEIAAWILWNLPPERFAEVLAALSPEQARERLTALPEMLAGSLDPAELARLQLDPLGLLSVLGNGSDGSQGGASNPMAGGPPPFLIVRAAQRLAHFQECIDFTDALRAEMARTLPGERRLLLTGRPAFTAEIARQMRADMALMMGIAVALVCAAFWLFYRTLRPLGWILFFQFLALLAGLIVARVCFGALNVISMGFASILLGVSMDYSILVYHHFASDQRGDARLWARLRRGIWFSAVTTAAAFLVLTFSSFPGLRQLSALVAVGLLGAALFATWLLRGVLAARPPTAPPVLDRVAHSAAAAVGRGRWPLLASALVIAVAGSWLLWQQPARFYQGDMRHFQPVGSPAWRGQQWLLQSDAAAKDAIYLVRGRTWDAVHLAAAKLQATAPAGGKSMWSWLLPAPAHQAVNRSAWPGTGLAPLRLEFEAAGLGKEWSEPTLATAATLERAAAGDASAFRAVEPLLATLAEEREGIITAVVRIPGAAEQPVSTAMLSPDAAEILPVNWGSLGSELTALARDDTARLGGWMLATLAVLCALAQRSLRLLLLNFAALFLALCLLALLLAAAGARLSPVSLLSVPLLLGLVIDYSLHVLMALEHTRGDLRHTYGHLGVPIVLTGLASCIGFGAPILTRQPALRNFGVVMDLGILAAVTTCLIFLPALYRATTLRKE